jgi:hypothetical protein
MFYVPSLGIYTQMSTYAGTNFHKQNSAFLGYLLVLRIWFAASAMRSQSWSSLFISTSYTKSFVWPQILKFKGVKSRDRGRVTIKNLAGFTTFTQV